jgi:hypothetical protein
MELPRDYLIQPVAMLRNAGREPAGLPVVIKSEQRSQSRRNAGRNRPEYAVMKTRIRLSRFNFNRRPGLYSQCGTDILDFLAGAPKERAQ